MKYIVENFESIDHLLKSNEVRSPNVVFAGRDHSSETGTEDFTGTESYKEAVGLFRFGYSKPLEKIKRGVEVNAMGLKKHNTTPRLGIVGFTPCVPNAILGLPNSMVNIEMEPKKSKIVSIVYDSCANCMTSEGTFIAAGIAVLTIVNSLEIQGYRVSLRVGFYNSKADKQAVYSTVKLKDWRQPLDIKKMAFPFCHPSMLRRIGFKWLETQPELTDTDFRGGYGSSLPNVKTYDEMRTYLKENKMIANDEKYINIPLCSSKDYDPQKIAKACDLEI